MSTKRDYKVGDLVVLTADAMTTFMVGEIKDCLKTVNSKKEITSVHYEVEVKAMSGNGVKTVRSTSATMMLASTFMARMKNPLPKEDDYL